MSWSQTRRRSQKSKVVATNNSSLRYVICSYLPRFRWFWRVWRRVALRWSGRRWVHPVDRTWHCGHQRRWSQHETRWVLPAVADLLSGCKHSSVSTIKRLKQLQLLGSWPKHSKFESLPTKKVDGTRTARLGFAFSQRQPTQIRLRLKYSKSLLLRQPNPHQSEFGAAGSRGHRFGVQKPLQHRQSAGIRECRSIEQLHYDRHSADNNFERNLFSFCTGASALAVNHWSIDLRWKIITSGRFLLTLEEIMQNLRQKFSLIVRCHKN